MSWGRLESGDVEAYRLFAESFGRKLERWLRWNGFSHADAIDVAEEGVVRVLLRLNRFKPTEPVEEKFLAWAWRVARNFAEDWRRTHRPERYRPLNDLDGSAIPTESLEQREADRVSKAADDARDAALRRLVNRLP